jgi:hypothetical protein
MEGISRLSHLFSLIYIHIIPRLVYFNISYAPISSDGILQGFLVHRTMERLHQCLSDMVRELYYQYRCEESESSIDLF